MSLAKDIMNRLNETQQEQWDALHGAMTNFGWKHDPKQSGKHAEIFTHPKLKGEKMIVHKKSSPLVKGVMGTVYRSSGLAGHTTHRTQTGHIKIANGSIANYLSDLASGR
jgi:hypothetical protein